MKQFDVAVIGGGVAGLSLAAGLAATRKVVVLEAESALGYHATGRSGAVFGRSYGNETILKLNRISADFFDTPPPDFADYPLIRPRPWLIVAREDQLKMAEKWVHLSAHLKSVEASEVPDASAGLLKRGYAALGLLDQGCGDLDVHGLIEGYRRAIKRFGGEIVVSACVNAIAQHGRSWSLETTAGKFSAPLIANTAGAWADNISGLIGLDPLGLQPYRRSAALIAPPSRVDLNHQPVVLDAEEQFYFKPDAGKLMVSSADETPSPPCDAQPEEIDIALAIDRYQTATDCEVRRVEHRWAGLRTFAPDRTPVVGLDPRREGLLWIAGQGGYGIQIAPALSELAVKLVNGECVDQNLAAALDPRRFIRP